MSDQFTILVNLDVRAEKKAFSKAEKAAKDSGKRAGNSFAASFGKNMKSQIVGTLKSFAGIFAVVQSFRTLTRVAGEAVVSIRSFERAMANVNSILPKNEKLTRASTDAFRDFAGSFATSSAKQADAFYTIVSAGVKETSKQLGVLEAANEAAIAGLVDINDSARVLVSSMNSYANAGLTATQASDILFVAVREGQTTFQELANFMGNVTPVAAAAGLKFEELAGAIAGITKAGIKTDIAVTGIRALLTSLIKVTPEAAAEAKRLGLEFGTSAIRGGKLVSFLAKLRKATNGNTESLGKLFPNVRALTPILQVVNGDFEDFTRIQGEVAKAIGATSDAAKIIKKNLDFKLQQANNNFKLLAQEISRNFTPTLGDAASSLSRWLVLHRDSASALSKNKARIGDLSIKLEEWTKIMNKQGVPALKEWTSNSTGAQREVFALTGAIAKLNKEAAKTKEAMRISESPYEKLNQAQRTLRDLKDQLASVEKKNSSFVESIKQGSSKASDAFNDMLTISKGVSTGEGFKDTSKLTEDIVAQEEKIKLLTTTIDLLKGSMSGVGDSGKVVVANMKGFATGLFDFFKDIKVGTDNMVKATERNVNKQKQLIQNITNIMKQAFTKIISSSIQMIVNDLRNGTLSLAKFANNFMSIIGDMAIQMGEAMILHGLAIDSLKSLNGAAAIAAGAGLIAIGSIIKSSFGSGGASSGSSSGAGGGGSSFAGDSTSENLTSPTQEERLPNTNVEIVIQGSLVHQEELGEFITETLNDSFGKQGLTLTDARFA